MPKKLSITLAAAFAFALILCACSNSEYADSSYYTIITANDDEVIESNNSNTDLSSSSSSIKEYLPLDDTEYPYAGIPRIVIETAKHQAIKDRETEIPAKLQIWGENKPESEIMDLTIRGRGNTSWTEMPKKSYKIEFINKQAILGMPKDRDWALIANYADKTLMKNYLMYHLSAKLGAYYAPRCEFAELYINREYLGVYLLTETIKIAKKRINIPENNESYIVEFDTRSQKDDLIFHSSVYPTIEEIFRIHAPKNASTKTLSLIENHITNFENYIKKIDPNTNNHLEQWIDIEEFIKHYWIQEFSKNSDAWYHRSVFFSWEKDSLIKMGPVWDFDVAFGGQSSELQNKKYENVSRLKPEGWFIILFHWNKFLFKDPILSESTKKYWKDNQNIFINVFNDIDSTKKKYSCCSRKQF